MVYWDSSQAAALGRALSDQFRDLTAHLAWMERPEPTVSNRQARAWSASSRVAPMHL